MEKLRDQVEALRSGLIAAVQQAVSIPSVQGEPAPGAPFGTEVDKALKQALAAAESLGFKTVNMDGYIGYAEYGEGEDYVAVLGHLDVVPEGRGWDHPPYGGEIHDGRMYGRGVMDDKGPIYAALYGLKAIKDLGLPLRKRVRILFGTNEETGCEDSKYYAAKERPPVSGFTPDGAFPVIYAEKGNFAFRLVKELKTGAKAGEWALTELTGGERSNMVPDYCEAVLTGGDSAAMIQACGEYAAKHGVRLSAAAEQAAVRIISRGVSAHGSTPEQGVNAIMQLAAFLGEYAVGGDAGSFITGINAIIGRETDGRSMGIAMKDEESGHLTFNAGTVAVKDGRVILTCNVRFPVTFQFDDIMASIRKTAAGAGFVVECDRHSDPLFFPKDHPLIRTLHRIFVEESGIEAEPLAIGGGTYAKTIPNIVAYGVEFPGKEAHMHEPNEFIEVEDLMLSAKIYARAIYELAQ